MIKEHKLYTKSDRTSCHRWEANQFRLFLHTAAYWLLHQLCRTAPRRSPWRTATFETLRRAFLKIAVRGTPGAYTERRLIAASALLKIPDGISGQTAAAALAKGLTAWYLIRRTVPIKKNDRILYHAAPRGASERFFASGPSTWVHP